MTVSTTSTTMKMGTMMVTTEVTEKEIMEVVITKIV